MADAPGRKWVNPYIVAVMSDGSEFGVQAYNPDLVRYERTASKHEWAGPDKEPINWLTFLAWSAGRREKKVSTDVTFEAFRDELCLQVSSPNGNEVRPTVAAPVAAS
jgi:hypothetical protein